MSSVFVVAIDGPAGSGKSSVSKEVARRLGFGYLDTGAAYRALTWAVMQGLPEQHLHSANLEESFEYSISTDPDDYWVRVGDTDVTQEIRESAVAEQVSSVAKVPAVRSFMKKLTRDIINNCSPGIIVEGRDITTVVAPDAQIRILLTASEAVRLKRRSAEVSAATEESIARQVSERDANDSKVVDFMTPAEGVELVDSSDLNFEQTVQAVLILIDQAKSR